MFNESITGKARLPFAFSLPRVPLFRWCGLLVFVLSFLLTSQGFACPFCTIETTLTERIDDSHAALGVIWISGKPSDAQKNLPGETTLRVIHIFRSHESHREIGDVVTLKEFHPGQIGQTCLMFGHLREGEVLRWDPPEPVSLTLIDYLIGRPDKQLSPAERLPYFLSFLEHSDEEIAVDAYSEFAQAEYWDVKALKAELPREKLRTWVSKPSPETGRVARKAFYGMLLGICGNDSDERLLEQEIFQEVPEYDLRIGIDGLMGGYLLLAGERGLNKLTKFAFEREDLSVEAFAVQKAVEFIWQYGEGSIPKTTLQESLHPLLNRPKLTDVALRTLTRWKDTSIVDRVAAMYQDPRFDDKELKMAMIVYFLEMSRVDPNELAEQDRQVPELALQQLIVIEKESPELVERARRMSFR